MEISEHIDCLQTAGTRLAAVAAHVGLERPVGHCPEWTVRDVLAHIGEVHRWATAVVGGALLNADGVTTDAAPSLDGDLVAWVQEGHRVLVETLRAAPTDLECFAFLPAPSPLAFWARRQALETTVHRFDIEAAGETATTIDSALALDGIEEMLLGFGGRRRVFEPGTIRLEPAGGEPWLISLGPEGAHSVRDGSDPHPADVRIGGSAAAVYLWLWNRPADVTVIGDPETAAQWQRVRVRWG